ncbi:MAG: hypothetical protein ACYSTR_09530, partial [Planctomycetota bacterium]
MALAFNPIRFPADFHPIQHIVTTRVLTSKGRLTILAPDKIKFLSFELLACNPFAMRQGVINDKIWWMLNPRAYTGVISNALAALDIALWDINGKQAGR